MNKTILREIFVQCWGKDTSNTPSLWQSISPSQGQCAVTALVIQDRFGGNICRIPNIEGQSHYYNVVGESIVDLTAEQFSSDIKYDGEQQDCQTIMSSEDTKERFGILSHRFSSVASADLSLKQVEHISIRDPSYVAGTNDRPEVRVFVQTNTRHLPLSNSKLCVGQTVWMKWVGGPIVARSKLLSWHSGDFSDGNINQLRELTVGSGLFGLNDYWQAVSSKKNGYFTVVHLSDEEWLEEIIYPTTKSYGSSWVYLDTDLKRCAWLSNFRGDNDKNTSERGRTLPAQLRFMVLRRDNYTCRYCGRKAPTVELHVDHVEPWTKVREHNIENLVASCRDCNLGKGALSA